MPEERSPILSSIKNIFSIPDLRNRVLFMLGLLAVYRIGAFIPTPGINHSALEAAFSGAIGNHIRFPGYLLRRKPEAIQHFRPGDHALHHRLHHPAACYRGGPLPGKAVQRRGVGAQEDYSIHALPDRRTDALPGFYDRDGTGALRRRDRAADRAEPRAGTSASW